MTPELAAFSDWLLALLPRLFVYPGGLSLLAALLIFRGISRGFPSIRPAALLRDLADASLLAIALVWVAIALAPLPGAAPLPFPVDRLALASLPALSLLLDQARQKPYVSLLAGSAITLALLLPAIDARTLLVATAPATWTLTTVCSVLAVLAGLLAFSWVEGGGLTGDVRWIAWLCLGLLPVFRAFALDSAWEACLALLPGMLLFGSARRLPLRRERAALWAAASALLLALLGLLATLPAPG